MTSRLVERPERDILRHLLDERLRRARARGDARKVEVTLWHAPASRRRWRLRGSRAPRCPPPPGRIVNSRGRTDCTGVPVDRHQRQDLILAESALDVPLAITP